MLVTLRDVEEGLPGQYDVEPADEGYMIYDGQDNGACVTFGVEDGTPNARVENWVAGTETLYLGQEESSRGLLTYEMFEEILSQDDIDEISRAEAILEQGLETASSAKSLDETIERLVGSAEDAYETLEDYRKEVTQFSLQSRPGKELGNAYATIGSEGVENGTEKAEIDMEGYEPEFATPATYIMGAVLLEGRNKKPEVSTGYAYKPGTEHHENQQRQANMDLVERATEITDYDFLNRPA